jgi:peptidoglycan/xylan/chitin deacetylase (PgdA/CDA1 family)
MRVPAESNTNKAQWGRASSLNRIAASAARWQSSCGCMLTFHRAAPSGEWSGLPNRDFYLNLDHLDHLLSYLTVNNWRIVTIDELLDRLKSGEKNARLVNVSVDDCYKDTWEHVVPLFRRHGVPVTLFVTTGIPDGSLALGWAGLETILGRHDRALFNNESVDISTPSAKRQWFSTISKVWEQGDFERDYQEFCRTNGADPAELDAAHAITWEMLDSFRGDPLVEIGAHTISHPRISALPADAALRELAGCRERLRSRLEVECRHFAFPYGRSGDCGPRDFNLAREAGFASAATTRKGLVRRNQDVFSLPRNTLNGAHQSMAYINAILSGLAGFAAEALRRV